MRIHVALVGGQPVGVFNAIVADNPDKIIYIYSKNSSNEKDRLKKELASYASDEVMLSPTDPYEITSAAEEIARKYAKDTVILNITSGLKSWSYLFWEVLRNMPDSQAVYIDQNNILWNYSTNENQVTPKAEFFTSFRLMGNPLEKYTKLDDYTKEDTKVQKEFESLSNQQHKYILGLCALLSKENQDKMRENNCGWFYQDKYDQGKKNKKPVYFSTDKNAVRGKWAWVYFDKGIGKDLQKVEINVGDRYHSFASQHAVDICFNSGWFEYKVARILNNWEHSQAIYMNCRFPFNKTIDKNEIDIIVETDTKLVFFECKTKIAHSTDIDKFHTVATAYGGRGSKQVFIVNGKMGKDSVEKCDTHNMLHFSIAENNNWQEVLFNQLNKEFENINK